MGKEEVAGKICGLGGYVHAGGGVWWGVWGWMGVWSRGRALLVDLSSVLLKDPGWFRL